MQPLRVLETVLYADDLRAAEAFYATVLELELEARQDGTYLFFRCGDGMLLVFRPDVTAAQSGLVPPHGARGAGHVAFASTAGELDAWVERLEARGVEVEARVDWPAGGRSIYFRDPAGNSLELATPQIWGFEQSP